MIEAYVRPIFQRYCVDSLASLICDRTTWTPNSITFAALIAGILSGACIVLHWSWLAVVFLWLSGYFDVLDGSVARLRQHSSEAGAVLDIVVDRVVEFIVLLALFSIDAATRGYAVIWMLGSNVLCITSFLVVGIFTQNSGKKSFHYSAGLMERAEAFIFYSIMIFIPIWFGVLAFVYVLLVLWTTGFRIFQFLET